VHRRVKPQKQDYKEGIVGKKCFGREVDSGLWNLKGSFEGRIAGTMDTYMDTNEKGATANVP